MSYFTINIKLKIFDIIKNNIASTFYILIDKIYYISLFCLFYIISIEL